eukprot:4855994-Heterocapsa_arctica.AAC.1
MIWRSFGEDRDYFIPLPSAGMQGVSRLPASYSDMACMSLVVIRSLRLPAWTPEADGHVGYWAASDLPLIGEHLV